MTAKSGAGAEHPATLTLKSLLEVVGLVALLPLDVAAGGGALGGGDGLAGEHRVHGGAQVLGGDGLAVARPAVVQLAPVDEAAVPVEQEKVGGAGRVVGFGHFLGLVI